MSSERREVTITVDGREIAGDRGGDAPRRGPARATSRSRSSVTSRSSATRSAPAGCAWSRSRGSRNCRPPARPRCATGMVVHTRTEQVKHAQSAVVEFLLVNHPLDCPVCDKGGECPLQDITMGWGPGKSRVIDEKRHFQKPIELSPLVAIDRERCILCYRCVRFSQEVAEDDQLQLLERGDRTFVGTFDDRPYVAPFHGNITELCPVGALTYYTYRFRARPWDIEQAGSVCTLCPSQCNVSFTVRDEQVKRVLGRDNAEVDDGWLCDRGRYGFEMFADERAGRRAAAEGGAAASWETGDRGGRRAACAQPAAPRPRRSSATPPTRRASWSSGIAARGARLAPRRLARLAAGPAARRWYGWPSPSSRPRSATSTTPTRSSSLGTDPLHSSPILDLRIRKAIRRNGARLAVATERPTALDGGAEAIGPLRPGGAGAFLRARGRCGHGPRRRWQRRRGTSARRRPAAPRCCSDAEQVVVDLGRADRARGRAQSMTPCSTSPPRSSSRGTEGCGPARSARRRQRPRPARGRLPPRRRPRPGGGRRRRPATPRRSATASSRASSKALVLFGVDPLRDFPDTRAWEARARPRPTSSSPSRCSRPRPPPRPTSSSRSRPTPRKTAPSPTPTAASSASAPAPPAPATSVPTPGPRRARRRPRPRHRHRLPAHGLRSSDRRGPLLRRHRPTPTIGGRGHPLAGRPPRPTPGAQGERRCTAPNVLRGGASSPEASAVHSPSTRSE